MKPEELDKKIRNMYEKDLEQIPVPNGLESRLSSMIDDLEVKETSKRRTLRPMWITLGSIAASFALVLSIGLFKEQEKPRELYAYINDIPSTTDGPEVAYQEALKALEKVSVNLNKGLTRLEKAEEGLEKTNVALQKTIKK